MKHKSGITNRRLNSRVVIVALLGVSGWMTSVSPAAINVTGRRQNGPVVVSNRVSNRLPRFIGRSQPFGSNTTFQTLDAEPGTGGSSPGNIIHPDPDDPSDMVFLSASPANVTLTAGASASVTVSVTRQGTPRASYIFMMGNPDGLGITISGLFGPMGTRTSRTFTIATTTAVPAGTYQMYLLGLTNENKYTEPCPVNVTVQAPPAPPPITTENVGTVTIVNTNLSIFTQGTYDLDGELQQVGAMFDNENDRIVNALPVGVNTVPYPRFPRPFGLGNWTIDVGRGYAGNGTVSANVVITALLDGQRFIAAHLRVSSTGGVTPILLSAGDLNNPGVVMTTDAFEFSIEGVTPSASAPGFIRGVVEGVPMFLSPDATVLWADGITFTFDVPLFND